MYFGNEYCAKRTILLVADVGRKTDHTRLPVRTATAGVLTRLHLRHNKYKYNGRKTDLGVLKRQEMTVGHNTVKRTLRHRRTRTITNRWAVRLDSDWSSNGRRSSASADPGSGRQDSAAVHASMATGHSQPAAGEVQPT